MRDFDKNKNTYYFFYCCNVIEDEKGENML